MLSKFHHSIYLSVSPIRVWHAWIKYIEKGFVLRAKNLASRRAVQRRGTPRKKIFCFLGKDMCFPLQVVVILTKENDFLLLQDLIIFYFYKGIGKKGFIYFMEFFNLSDMKSVGRFFSFLFNENEVCQSRYIKQC